MDDQLVSYFNSEIERLGNAALAITTKAETEGRAKTEEENREIERMVKDMETHRTRLNEIKQGQDLKDRIEKMKESGINVPPSKGPEDARTLGEAILSSAAFQGLKARGAGGSPWSTGSIEIKGSFSDQGIKLTDGDTPVSTVVSITAGGGTLPLNPQIASPPVSPSYENPLVVAALFGQGTANTNTLVWLEETTTSAGTISDPSHRPMYSDSDSVVATTSEGQNKPAAFVDFTKRTVTLTKVAAFLPISEETMEDESQLASYINGRLSVFVRQAEDSFLLTQLVNSGIPSGAGSQIGGSNNWYDAVADGIMRVQRDGGANPDAVIMNPADFWTMATSKATTQGQYFGDPFGSQPRNPWGLRTVVTNRQPTGTAIVGAFREGATVWRKGGLSVEASNSHNDYFRKNLIALRAEERIALAVYKPLAFAQVVR